MYTYIYVLSVTRNTAAAAAADDDDDDDDDDSKITIERHHMIYVFTFCLKYPKSLKG